MGAVEAVSIAITVALALPIGITVWLLGSYARFRAYHRFKRSEHPPVATLARYLAGEVRAVLTLLWWHAIAAFRDGLRMPRGRASGPPVLCVHGIVQAGSNMWGFRRALEARGRPTRAVSLGRHRLTLEAYMAPLERALRELVAASPDGQVDVVAHSMGGIILRMVLARDPELATHVRRVVTLGSPHAGTAGARGLPLATVRALGRRSPLLRDLSTFPSTARLTTIAARHDLVVYPQETCHLAGATVIDLEGPGHTGLLTSRASIERVVEVICGEEPT